LGSGLTDYSAAQPGESHAHHLLETLRARFTINQAIGVLMAAHGITADQAGISFRERFAQATNNP
jgi:hypothetical protein